MKFLLSESDSVSSRERQEEIQDSCTALVSVVPGERTHSVTKGSGEERGKGACDSGVYWCCRAELVNAGHAPQTG